MFTIIAYFLCAVMFSAAATLNAIQGGILLTSLNIFTVICFFLAGTLSVKNYKNKH